MNYINAFKQAQDYRNEVDQLNIYLSMLKYFPPNEVPAFIHMDIGFQAFRAKDDEFALYAIYQAINQGIDHRDEQICRALESIYQRRNDNDRSAIIASIRESL